MYYIRLSIKYPTINITHKQLVKGAEENKLVIIVEGCPTYRT